MVNIDDHRTAAVADPFLTLYELEPWAAWPPLAPIKKKNGVGISPSPLFAAAKAFGDSAAEFDLAFNDAVEIDIATNSYPSDNFTFTANVHVLATVDALATWANGTALVTWHQATSPTPIGFGFVLPGSSRHAEIACATQPVSSDVAATPNGFFAAFALANPPVWTGISSCVADSGEGVQVVRVDASGHQLGSVASFPADNRVTRVRLAPATGGGVWLTWSVDEGGGLVTNTLAALDQNGNVVVPPETLDTLLVGQDATSAALVSFGSGVLQVYASHAVNGFDGISFQRALGDGTLRHDGGSQLLSAAGVAIVSPLVAASSGSRAIVGWTDAPAGGTQGTLEIAAFCTPD